MIFSNIFCQKCNGSLKITLDRGDSKILSCKCSNYPVIENIIYLQNNRLKERCLQFIRRGNYIGAIATLMDVRRLLRFPIILFLTIEPKIAIIKKVFNKNLYEVLGFNNFVKILSRLTYSKSWSRYLVDRNNITSFKVSSKLESSLENKELKVLDFGCGVGQLLPFIKVKNLVALDKSFLNLYFARKYFATDNTLLVCADGERGLPFNNQFLDQIFASDCFISLKNREKFVSESSRVLNRRGSLKIVNIINTQNVVYARITGVKFKNCVKMLQKNKFNKISIFTDREILDKDNQEISKVSSSGYIPNKLKEKQSYNAIAIKS